MHRRAGILFGTAWLVLLFPAGVAPAASCALLGMALGVLAWSAPTRGNRAVLLVASGASCVVAWSSHAGILLLAWLVSGGALTQIVRREGGETSGKPGRVLELQQHISSVLILLVLATMTTLGRSWDLSAIPSAYVLRDRIAGRLSAAGLQRGPEIWDLGVTGVLSLAAVLRVGVFPFPFSVRRSARRLNGMPLLALLAVFMPTSLWAVARLSSNAEAYGVHSLGLTAAIIGATTLVTCALWLQVEWLGESLIGLVAQCYAGLALLGIGSGDVGRTGLVLLQATAACGFGVVWTMRMRALAHTSDLAKAAPGYETSRELHVWHGLFVLFACPWPGSPAGLVWMGLLGRSIAAGTGFGFLVLLGVTLLFCGLFRSIGKVRVRLHGGSGVTTDSLEQREPQLESIG